MQCTAWWFDICTYCERIPSIGLIHTSTTSHTYLFFFFFWWEVIFLKECSDTVVLRIGSRLARVETDAVIKCGVLFLQHFYVWKSSCQVLPYIATYLWLHKVLFPNYITWYSVVFFNFITDKRHGPLEES